MAKAEPTGRSTRKPASATKAAKAAEVADAAADDPIVFTPAAEMVAAVSPSKTGPSVRRLSKVGVDAESAGLESDFADPAAAEPGILPHELGELVYDNVKLPGACKYRQVDRRDQERYISAGMAVLAAFGPRFSAAPPEPGPSVVTLPNSALTIASPNPIVPGTPPELLPPAEPAVPPPTQSEPPDPGDEESKKDEG